MTVFLFISLVSLGFDVLYHIKKRILMRRRVVFTFNVPYLAFENLKDFYLLTPFLFQHIKSAFRISIPFYNKLTE